MYRTAQLGLGPPHELSVCAPMVVAKHMHLKKQRSILIMKEVFHNFENYDIELKNIKKIYYYA